MAGDDRGELTRRSDSGDLAERDEELDPEEAHIAELRASIEATRERVTQSIDRVQYEVEDALDWREWVEDHPWEAVGTAFAVGFFIGFR